MMSSYQEKRVKGSKFKTLQNLIYDMKKNILQVLASMAGAGIGCAAATLFGGKEKDNDAPKEEAPKEEAPAVEK